MIEPKGYMRVTSSCRRRSYKNLSFCLASLDGATSTLRRILRYTAVRSVWCRHQVAAPPSPRFVLFFVVSNSISVVSRNHFVHCVRALLCLCCCALRRRSLSQVRLRLGEPTSRDGVSCYVCCPALLPPSVSACLSAARGYSVALPLACLPHHARCVLCAWRLGNRQGVSASVMTTCRNRGIGHRIVDIGSFGFL